MTAGHQGHCVQIVRRRVHVRGVVQGVGFRPFVSRLATELGLAGACCNDVSGVWIEVEGLAHAIEEFLRRIRPEAPPLARIHDVLTEDDVVQGDAGFVIRNSQATLEPRTLVPPDTATCADCLRELFDPRDRRYRHPFITCTNCGPRLTIITDLPYDRGATTMAAMPMCERCTREYADPMDRRYHAQPIACHDCGPELAWSGPDGEAGGDDAIAAAQQALRDGLIVAIKGVGGYHLACDARQLAPITRLRALKDRPDKPFAMMVADLEAIADMVLLDDHIARSITSQAGAIVLVPFRTDAPLSPMALAPGMDEFGVMLPYAPVHHLLFAPHPQTGLAAPRMLVMTSGNVSGEPLCYRDEDARAQLTRIADGFLTHDRPIHVPCEDSVVTVVDGAEVPIRRSRGYAPLPVLLDCDGPAVFGVGAELKNTCCLARGDMAFCSAHIADMGSLASQASFATAATQLLALHDATPELLVADSHPAYQTRIWAEVTGAANGIPVHFVQHHHAHLAALLAEHGRTRDPVVAVAYDGTGMGCDGTIWGGEILASAGDLTEVERAGHLAPFRLVGGDAAVRNPIRVAIALLHEAGIPEFAQQLLGRGLAAGELGAVRAQLDAGRGTVTTSAGRLIDGVSALLGIRARVTFEAQAAIEMEVIADTASGPAGELDFPCKQGVMDWRPAIRQLAQACLLGEDSAGLALAFELALARAAVSTAHDAARARGIETVGLTGGVFQNRMLLREMSWLLQERGRQVLTHRLVPCNDGGLALGQVVLGRAHLAKWGS